MNNKVVARYADGRILKGMTADFVPGREVFHVTPRGASVETPPVEVRTSDLKALFFVKDFDGDPNHVEANAFSPDNPPEGRAIRVAFRDGEVLVGSTTATGPAGPGSSWCQRTGSPTSSGATWWSRPRSTLTSSTTPPNDAVPRQPRTARAA
jgi:hypothetical protein